MAGPLRIEYPGAVCHVTARGNARMPIFENDGDLASFLQIAEDAVERGWPGRLVYPGANARGALMKSRFRTTLGTDKGVVLFNAPGIDFTAGRAGICPEAVRARISHFNFLPSAPADESAVSPAQPDKAEMYEYKT